MSNTQAKALGELFDETVALFHRLRWSAGILHEPGGQGEALTAARRGVLRSLREEGARTVPDLARSRKVSRQHIQGVVNELERRGLVELVDNPSHKRSRLVELTARGREALQAMLERETDFLGSLDPAVPLDDLRSAASTLRSVRGVLQASLEARERKEAAREDEA